MTELADELVVVAALRLEVRALRRAVRGLPVLRCGMGAERARRAAARIFAERARSVAVAGLCGGLDAAQPVGAVVVASEVCGPDGSAFPCEHEVLCEELRRLGIEPQQGPIASTDHVVRGDERDALRETGALAVDMESSWLTRASKDRPFAVLRVVLDAPGRDLMRPGTVPDSFRALARLGEAAPALLAWARRMPGAFDASQSRSAETLEPRRT